jgi:hypothetical protein
VAKYAIEMNRTGHATLPVGSVTAHGTRPRRGKIYDLIFGSEASPADNPFLWQVQRHTGAGTSTPVTAQPLDPGDAATELLAGEAHTVDVTATATAFLLSVALNQRATFRWVAAPGGELVYPATASNGLHVRTPTMSAVAISATVHVDEQ